ncbi:UNVERIFIED_CONTAM: hypothetical protein FKN15_033303 [Acipenser sinensis]
MEAFIGAVTPAALREHLLLKEPMSLKEAIAEGRHLEKILDTTRVAPRDHVAASTDLGVAPSPIRRYQARPYTTYPDRRLCWHCNKPGHLQARNRSLHVCALHHWRDGVSTVTLLQPGVLQQWGAASEETWEPTHAILRTVSGQVTPMKGPETLSMHLGPVGMQHTMWLADIREQCILGSDVLAAMGVIHDLEEGMLRTKKGACTLQLHLERSHGEGGETAYPPASNHASQQACPLTSPAAC